MYIQKITNKKPKKVVKIEITKEFGFSNFLTQNFRAINSSIFNASWIIGDMFEHISNLFKHYSLCLNYCKLYEHCQRNFDYECKQINDFFEKYNFNFSLPKVAKLSCEFLQTWEDDHDPTDPNDMCPCEGCMSRKELYNDCPLGL